MANYATLKSAIEQVIKTNGNNEITGALLQQSLLAMINSLGAGYQFVGIATPTTNPGTPDYNVFYIASTAGTYSNFPDSNNVPLVLNDGEIAILKYNGTWTKDVTGAATAEKVTQLGQEIREEMLGAEYVPVEGTGVYNTSGVWVASVIWKSKSIGGIPVSEGDRFLYKGYGSSSYPSVFFYNGTTLQSYSYVISESSPVEIVVPAGVDNIRFQSFAAAANNVTFFVVKKNNLKERVSVNENRIKSISEKMLGYDGVPVENNTTIGYYDTSFDLIKDPTRHSIYSQILPTAAGEKWRIKVYGTTTPVNSPSIFYYNGASIVGYEYVDSGWVTPLEKTIPSIINGNPVTIDGVRFVTWQGLSLPLDKFFYEKENSVKSIVTDAARNFYTRDELGLIGGKMLQTDTGTGKDKVINVSGNGYVDTYLPIAEIAEFYKGTFTFVSFRFYDAELNVLGNTPYLRNNCYTNQELYELANNPSVVYVRANLYNGGATVDMSKNNIFVKRTGVRNFAYLTNKGVVISDYANELMTQCPSAQYANDGYIYLAYYASTTTKIEGYTNDVKCRLAKVPICNPANPQFLDVLKRGDVVGGFTQSSQCAPYDPQIVVSGDTINYLMAAIDGTLADAKTKYQYVCRTINKNTLALGSALTPLMLSYTSGGNTYNVEMRQDNLSVFIDRITGRAIGTSNNGDYPILSKIINDGTYYYAYLGGLQGNDGKGFGGAIIRSTDCINWEFVASPTQLNITKLWEGAIAKIGTKIYVCLRYGDTPLLYYDLSTSTWSEAVDVMAGQQDGYMGRNELFVEGGMLYAIANSSFKLNNVMRTCANLVMYDTSLNEKKRFVLYNENGIVYPIVVKTLRKMYYISTEGRRWPVDPNILTASAYPCSEIVLHQMDYLYH